MASVEEFVARLGAALDKRPRHGSNNDYIMVNDLRQACAQALQPETLDEQYPRMLFKHGSRSETRVVASADEEAAAAVEGYVRVPLPLYEAGFPQAWIERPFDLGGTKRGPDFRRVMLFNSAQKELFATVVDIADWVEDDHQHGCGRGIGLDVLVAERKEQLKRLIDAEELTLGSESSDAEAPELPCDVTPENTTKTSLDPDSVATEARKHA